MRALLESPNGAGKSTLLGILSTLVRATAGTVGYLEGDRRRKLDDRLRADIGLLAHSSLCYGELTAVENLEFFATLYGVADGGAGADAARRGRARRPARDRAQRTYRAAWCSGWRWPARSWPGCRQLLLDEPFTGLDRGGALRAGRAAGAGHGRRRSSCVTHDLGSSPGSPITSRSGRQAGARRPRPGGVPVRGAARAPPRPMPVGRCRRRRRAMRCRPVARRGGPAYNRPPWGTPAPRRRRGQGPEGRASRSREILLHDGAVRGGDRGGVLPAFLVKDRRRWRRRCRAGGVGGGGVRRSIGLGPAFERARGDTMRALLVAGAAAGDLAGERPWRTRSWWWRSRR
ncbi:MAG: ATP-binding cassette domain-containing protein, partial [Myxococcales bacterium]|nr:ATP-binding cassette domain-containing protein [Myxococcales bacterium]